MGRRLRVDLRPPVYLLGRWKDPWAGGNLPMVSERVIPSAQGHRRNLLTLNPSGGPLPSPLTPVHLYFLASLKPHRMRSLTSLPSSPWLIHWSALNTSNLFNTSDFESTYSFHFQTPPYTLQKKMLLTPGDSEAESEPESPPRGVHRASASSTSHPHSSAPGANRRSVASPGEV